MTDTVPTPYPPEYWRDHPIIQQAEMALRAFGRDLSRADAERLLPLWVHNAALTDRERAAILDRFGSPGDAGWLSGSMGTTP